MLLGPYLIPMAVSFFVGSFGYILYFFWLRPVLRYRGEKRRVAAALNAFINQGEAGEEEKTKGKTKGKKSQAEIFSRCAGSLTMCFNDQLPDWYRLLITRRGESPLDASKHLTVLSNTKDREHAARRVEKIKQALNFK
ncbi:MAG: hypothetical protein GY859_39770 [Desulfobacterales bacterium]|nr:hypothetical protein [Desulfobacterales bacterium]